MNTDRSRHNAPPLDDSGAHVRELKLSDRLLALRMIHAAILMTGPPVKAKTMRSKSVVNETRDILLVIEWIQLGAQRSVRGGTHRAGPVATAGAAA